jgi:trimethylguanosine synthase
VDIFGGAGGNVIAFALSGRWERIIAIEKDADTLACAQHNAGVYEVPDGIITWVLGDSFDFLAAAREGNIKDQDLAISPESTVIFASPPWGGVDYTKQEIFDLSTMEPYNLDQLHQACHPMQHALYLPRTSDLRQVAALVEDDTKIDVVQYCLKRSSKAMVAYFPEASHNA